MCMVWRKKCWQCNELFSRSTDVQYIYVPILLYQYDLAGVLYTVCDLLMQRTVSGTVSTYTHSGGPRFRATCKDCKCSKNCLQIGAPRQSAAVILGPATPPWCVKWRWLLRGLHTHKRADTKDDISRSQKDWHGSATLDVWSPPFDVWYDGWFLLYLISTLITPAVVPKWRTLFEIIFWNFFAVDI